MLQKIYLIVSLLLILVLPAWAAPVGMLQRISGEVMLRSEKVAAFTPARPNTALNEAAAVRTGANGWAELHLSDGSTLTLGNSTELELSSLKIAKRKKEGLFSLNGGKLRARVTRLVGQQTDFRFRSPTAVAGVKGTEFLMLSRGMANVLFGVDGMVVVSGTAKSSGQTLASGTMLQTTRGATPAAAIRVDREPALVDAQQVLDQATGAEPPTDWAAADRLPDMLARWNVNYGRYLADKGEYEQALAAFQIAIDLTAVAEIRSDAWLERGTVYGRQLGNPRAALAEYELVLEEYPRLPQAETALFSAGQVLMELGVDDQAAARFRHYLQAYPNGRHRSNVEMLLLQMEHTR
jgi:tetratricopeptide (TPR) repeat protein